MQDDKLDRTTIEKLLKFLGPFYEATEEMSGSTYSTISVSLRLLPLLIEHSATSWQDPDLSIAARGIKSKLEEYENSINSNLAYISFVLDPRLKTTWLTEPTKTNTLLKLRQLIDNRDNGSSTQDASVESQQSSSTQQLPDTQQSTNAQQSSSAQQSFFKRIFVNSSDVGDELDTYLKSPLEKDNVNITKYWKTNEKALPKLARLARIVLCVQPTSVASERIFSEAGLVDTDRRSKLSSDSFESTMKSSSWLKFISE